MKTSFAHKLAAGSLSLGLLAAVGAPVANAQPVNAAPAPAVVAPAAVKAASNTLIAIKQMSTGKAAAYNCGPTAVVIALKGVGKTPSGYKTSAIQAVKNVRTSIGHSRPTDLISDLKPQITKYGVKATKVTYAQGLAAAAKGKTVILHTNLYGGHYIVAKGKDASGRIFISDPANGSKSAKTVAYLTSIKRSLNRALVLG
ncbi:MAG: hypothetical protein LBE25_01320 [Arthrobacter sp.]|jgi:hypothetical protein|nr:hypothetical protein [Arthrobacter sp.]